MEKDLKSNLPPAFRFYRFFAEASIYRSLLGMTNKEVSRAHEKGV